MQANTPASPVKTMILSYMQGSKGDTHVKDRLLDSEGGESGMIWENSFETCALPRVK